MLACEGGNNRQIFFLFLLVAVFLRNEKSRGLGVAAREKQQTKRRKKTKELRKEEKEGRKGRKRKRFVGVPFLLWFVAVRAGQTIGKLHLCDLADGPSQTRRSISPVDEIKDGLGHLKVQKP